MKITGINYIPDYANHLFISVGVVVRIESKCFWVVNNQSNTVMGVLKDVCSERCVPHGYFDLN